MAVGVEARMVLRSPFGRYVASCVLAPPVTGPARILGQTGRIRGDVIRLVVTSIGGAVHEVKVVYGWFALAWIDPYGGPAFAGLKAYDASGRLLYQR